MTEDHWLTSDDPRPMLNFLKNGNNLLSPEFSHRKLRLFYCACCRHVWYLLANDRSRDAVVVAERYADGDATANEMIDARLAAQAIHNNYSDEMKAAVDDVMTAASHDNTILTMYAAAHAADYDAQVNIIRDIAGNPFRRIVFDPMWRTPGVLELARAAYIARPNYRCLVCNGYGYINNKFDGKMDCKNCDGQGRIDRGYLEQDRLAVLADAMEDAGCDCTPLLMHLRGFEYCKKCLGTGIIRVKHKDGHGDTDTVLCNKCNPNSKLRMIGIRSSTSGWIKCDSNHVRGCWALDLCLGSD